MEIDPLRVLGTLFDWRFGTARLLRQSRLDRGLLHLKAVLGLRKTDNLVKTRRRRREDG